jgi:hypothetical protein
MHYYSVLVVCIMYVYTICIHFGVYYCLCILILYAIYYSSK